MAAIVTSRSSAHGFRTVSTRHRQYSTSRRINIPPPFPVTPSCPEPTCPCAPTPAGLDIDHSQALNGTMAPYSQQVLISTGQNDWRSRIEDDGLDKGWGKLGSRLKKLISRTGKFSDPYNNVMITNSSFGSSSNAQTNADSASAFLFPSFRYLPDIPLDEDGLDRFVRAFLLPLNVHKAHNVLPQEKQEGMKRVPELESTFPEAMRMEHSPTILICGHGGRDQRCGVMGPLLQAEFSRVLQSVGYGTGGMTIDRKDHANVGLISHIGGHKFAGNVIMYLPPSIRQNSNASSTFAGKGIWYGRVEPRHVEGIVKETLLEGRIVADHFRGGIDEGGGILRL